MASLLNKSDIVSNHSERVLVSDADYAAVELFRGYPESLLVFAYWCCVVSMIIGIPGNIVTIAALARYKRVRNATAIFIMNLSCANLLFCCLAPGLSGSVFRHRAWIHGRLLCHVYPCVSYILIAVSIFTILAITINRYVIIVYPKIYRKLYQKRNLVIMLAAIWISPILILMPTILGKWGTFGLDPVNGSCTLIPDQNKRSPKHFLSVVVFSVPCIPIFLCYGRIYFVVRKTSQSLQNPKIPSQSNRDTTTSNSSSIIVEATPLATHNGEDTADVLSKNIGVANSRHFTVTLKVPNEITATDSNPEDTEDPSVRTITRKNALRRSKALLMTSRPTRKDKRLKTMILAIIISFCLCHLPILLTKVMRCIINPSPTVNIAAYLVFYSSSYVNPVIYVVMSREYKKAYRNLFQRVL